MFSIKVIRPASLDVILRENSLPEILRISTLSPISFVVIQERMTNKFPCSANSQFAQDYNLHNLLVFRIYKTRGLKRKV